MRYRRHLFLTAAMLLQSFHLALAADEVRYGFVLHAPFFSNEARVPNLLDPHVFVADPVTAEAVGPQGITHAAGFRPALMVDDPAQTLFNAKGKPLDMTLRQWFSAYGSYVGTRQNDGSERIVATFAGLIPNGHYSLFENHFAPAGVTFTPLDDKGIGNNVVARADGTATLTLTAPARLTHDNAVLLVYHSDGRDHGVERGTIGDTAHHQLISRP